MGKPLHVLIIEDSEEDTQLFVRELRQRGYEVEFERVETAEAMQLALIQKSWDLILSDYILPTFDAPHALEVLKASGLDVPLIIISSTTGEDTAVAALKAGANDFLVKGKFVRLTSAIDRELRQAESRRDRTQAEPPARLFENLQASNRELVGAYDNTLEGLSRALDLREQQPDGHTLRVTAMATKLARSCGLSEEDLMHIRRGSLLHDIGKMGVPENILLKSSGLTLQEWVRMRTHPQYAYELLQPIAFLAPALDIPYCHHENWDGTGYPRGIKGYQIPLAARLFAIVDV
jgi:putative nucleotidyltransferase with HDIG domain